MRIFENLTDTRWWPGHRLGSETSAVPPPALVSLSFWIGAGRKLGGGADWKRAWLFTQGRGEFPWLRAGTNLRCLPAACPPGPTAPKAKDKPKQPGQRVYVTAAGIRVCIGRSCLLGKHHSVIGFFPPLQTSSPQHWPHNPPQGLSVLLTQRHEWCHSNPEIKGTLPPVVVGTSSREQHQPSGN